MSNDQKVLISHISKGYYLLGKSRWRGIGQNASCQSEQEPGVERRATYKYKAFEGRSKELVCQAYLKPTGKGMQFSQKSILSHRKSQVW